jgi:serine/threonine protein kinase
VDNLLLDDRYHIKVTDFGCAHGPAKTDREKELHAHVGALSHRAPELHMKLPFDGKVDSWSIG